MRDRYASTRDFTHYSGSFKVYARLDYFFMFKVDRFRVRECDILTRDLSDHRPISLSLQVAMKKRTTLWKFNSHLFNDPAIVSKLKEDIKEFLEVNDTGEVSPTILWDTLKAVMRGKVISIATQL